MASTETVNPPALKPAAIFERDSASAVQQDAPPSVNRAMPIWVPLVFCLVGTVAFFFDRQLSEWFSAGSLPGDLRRLVTFSEVFAHGLGVGLILIAGAVVAPHLRRRVIWVAIMAYSAGITADLIKLFVHRPRPDFAEEGTLVISNWFGLQIGAPQALGYAFESFPSAHTATAFGLAVGLSWLTGRGRYLFLCFAILAALQRVVSGAHYVSDILFGAALGLSLSSLWLSDKIPWIVRLRRRVIGK